MIRLFLFSFSMLITGAAMANINNIECEETSDGGRRNLTFARESFQLIESEEKVNSEGNTYWRQELVVLNEKSLCGVPIKTTDCDIKDSSIGEILTIEITCRGQNEALYANMIVSMMKIDQFWDVERMCALTISSQFRKERFSGCRIK